MKVAVILPSRGLIFSRTAQEIIENVKGINYKFFFAHKLPIPDCFEKPTRAALADPEITHLWFIEDDMILPPGTLKTLLDANEDAITCDYPVTKEGQGAVFLDRKRTVVFSGTGCLLVKREVLRKKPYFRTDIKWGINNYSDHVTFISSRHGKGIESYGLHDVTFGIRLYYEGNPIKLHPIKLGQRKLIALGKAGTNDGAHNIEEWTKVIKDFYLKDVKKWPPMPQGSLVTVQTPTGQVQTDKTHAAKLIRKGLGTRPPKTGVVIDDLAGLL